MQIHSQEVNPILYLQPISLTDKLKNLSKNQIKIAVSQSIL